jgi:hypothetical protein
MVAHKNRQKAKLVQEKPNHYMELDFNVSNYMHNKFPNLNINVDITLIVLFITSQNAIFGDLQ